MLRDLDQIEGIVMCSLFMLPEQPDTDRVRGASRAHRLSEDDADAIAREVSTVTVAAPLVAASAASGGPPLQARPTLVLVLGLA